MNKSNIYLNYQVVSGYLYKDDYDNTAIVILDFTDDDFTDDDFNYADIFIDSEDFLLNNLQYPKHDEYLYFLAKIQAKSYVSKSYFDADEGVVELSLLDAKYMNMTQ